MMQQDIVMSQLSQELDNGRLLRLLSRLVMVSEGSPTSLEPNWSETGLYASGAAYIGCTHSSCHEDNNPTCASCQYDP